MGEIVLHLLGRACDHVYSCSSSINSSRRSATYAARRSKVQAWDTFQFSHLALVREVDDIMFYFVKINDVLFLKFFAEFKLKVVYTVDTENIYTLSLNSLLNVKRLFSQYWVRFFPFEFWKKSTNFLSKIFLHWTISFYKPWPWRSKSSQYKNLLYLKFIVFFIKYIDTWRIFTNVVLVLRPLSGNVLLLNEIK